MEELRNFLFVLRKHDSLGNQAIEAGIRGEGDEIDITDEDAVGIDLSRKKRFDFGGRMRAEVTTVAAMMLP